MPTANYGVVLSAGGVNINKSVIRTGDHTNAYEVTLPVGVAGTLSTRTDNDTGILTVGSGHGITAADTVDIHWDGGVRFRVDVTAVTATTISFDLGYGDNLPVATTAIVVTKIVPISTMFDGSGLQILGICAEAANPNSDATAHLDVQNAAGTVVEFDLEANVPQIYDVRGGTANPFAVTDPDIVLTNASNGDATDALTLKIICLIDATP